MRIGFYSKLLLGLLAIALFSCKHRQKEIPVAKKTVAKKKHAKNPVNVVVKTESGQGVSALKEKLGISEKEIRNNKLYSFINEWYGVPYKYSGCQRSGVDCSCFTNILYEKVYGKKLARTASGMYTECDQTDPEHAREGDLFFFKINGNDITHVGVYLKNNYFVHSSVSKGVIINSLDEAYYKKYFFCVGKFKNT